MALFALAPILLSIVLLVGLRWPAARAMPVCAVASALVSGVVWQVSPVVIGAAVVEAGFITVSILLILFGAVWLMEQLTAVGALDTLKRWLSTLTDDRLLQALLIGWIVGSFFEGAAGFGAPAVVTAPLLVALGFPAPAAVVAALVGDSVAVSFGAVGTPLLVGMAEGLPAQSALTPTAVAEQLVVYDAFVGPLMPVLLVWTLGLGFGGAGASKACLATTPLALVIGASHLAVTAGTVFFVGLELPSLLGPLAALLLALVFLKRRWLVPTEAFRFSHEQAPGLAAPARGSGPSLSRVLAATAPYCLLVLLLVATRLPALGLRGPLEGASLEYPRIFGTDISARLQPLYSPFAAFAVVTLMTRFWFGSKADKSTEAGNLARSARLALSRIAKAALPLGAAVATVRIFIHSEGGALGLPAMPLLVGGELSSALGRAWPLFAPWLGALGAFIAGSATFSNLLFAEVQHTVALSRDWSPDGILALQAMGAAAGNMVCVHNVVAALAVVGLVGKESSVIARTAVPMAIYLVSSGVVVWVWLSTNG